MLVCVLRLMDWMRASSPKATSLIASGKYRRRWWGDAYRKRKRRGCWLTSNNALGPMASAYQSSCRVRYQIGSALPLIRSPRRRAGSAEVGEGHRADGGREFLFLVADIPGADYFARCVLDRVITGHVRFAEDVDFAVESLTFVDIPIAFPLGSRMVPSARPRTLPGTLVDTRKPRRRRCKSASSSRPQACASRPVSALAAGLLSCVCRYTRRRLASGGAGHSVDDAGWRA